MATGGGVGWFSAIPGGGAGRGRHLERHNEARDPFGGQRGRGVLTGEPVCGGVIRRRGTTMVEVDHRSREPARWTVISTERLWSLSR
jgi:hypothetical protein